MGDGGALWVTEDAWGSGDPKSGFGGSGCVDNGKASRIQTIRVVLVVRWGSGGAAAAAGCWLGCTFTRTEAAADGSAGALGVVLPFVGEGGVGGWWK